MTHYKDPYGTNRIMESKRVLFVAQMGFTGVLKVMTHPEISGKVIWEFTYNSFFVLAHLVDVFIFVFGRNPSHSL